MTWIGTRSGLALDYLNPQPEQISIDDIASGLSNVCRFAGQLDTFYSVAQHSVMVSKAAYRETSDPVIAMQGLLHDASESYTGDCPSPLKKLLAHSWTGFENMLQSIIYKKFGVPTAMHFHVKQADIRWLVTEKEQLQTDGPSWEGTAYEHVNPYGNVIDPLSSTYARAAFLDQFYILKNKIEALQPGTELVSA